LWARGVIFNLNDSLLRRCTISKKACEAKGLKAIRMIYFDSAGKNPKKAATEY